MKKWIDLTLDNKKKDINDRFEYTNKVMNIDQETALNQFQFDSFKKNKTYFSQYNYFKDRLSNNTLFLASGYGFYEFFLKGTFKNFLCSDSEEKYINFNHKNRLSNFIKFDATNKDDIGKINFTPQNIVLNNVEYLFDDNELTGCLENIHTLSDENTKVYIIFRSRYYYLIDFFYKFLIPAEFLLKKVILQIFGKKKYINSNFHGFLRKKKDFEKILKKRFIIKNLYKDLYSLNYERSLIINKLKLGKIFSLIFFKLHPYLHIYELRIK